MLHRVAGYFQLKRTVKRTLRAEGAAMLNCGGRTVKRADIDSAIALGDDEAVLRRSRDWLLQALQSTGSNGVAALNSLTSGYAAAYPETTGYIATTLINYGTQLRDVTALEAGRRCADWLLRVQYSDGSIQAGYEGMKLPGCIFNTGMVLSGWISAYEKFGEARYLEAAKRAGDWLLSSMDADGCWRRNLSQFADPLPFNTYNVLVAWEMARLGKAAKTTKYLDGARRNVEWTLSQLQANGYIVGCGMAGFEGGLTHPLAYSIQGLFEAGLILEMPAAVEGALTTLTALTMKQHRRGGWAGVYGADWKPRSSWDCLTGTAQIAQMMYRAWEHTGKNEFLDSFLRAVVWLKRRQTYCAEDASLHGGMFGSFPVWGGYMPYAQPNWATKYFIDLMLAKQTWTRLQPAPEKRLLFVSYRFPPQNVGGVIRAVKFIKYLARRGWHVDVLAPSGSNTRGFETDLNHPNIRLTLVKESRPLQRLLGWRRSLSMNTATGAAKSGTSTNNTQRPASFWMRCLRLLEIPDEAAGWRRQLRRAVQRYLRLHPQTRRVFVHGPPFGHFMTLLHGNRTWKRLLHFDFRDPWSGDLHFHYPFAFVERRVQAEEREVLRSGCTISVTTEGQERQFHNTEPMTHGRVAVIRNGFDPDDLQSTMQTPRLESTPERFILLHAGSTLERPTDQFFAGLRHFLRQDPRARAQTMVHFYGPTDPRLQELVHRFELQPYCTIAPAVSHETVESIMHRASVLLLFLAQSKIVETTVPGKLYEYVGAGLPIVAFGASGEAQQLINNNGWGDYFAGTVGPEDVARCLEKHYHGWREGKLVKTVDAKVLNSFSRPHLTEALEKLLSYTEPLC